MTSFTGQSRTRKTRWAVRLGDGLARWLITVGGLATIGAVLTVVVVLAWQVVPLFRSARVQSAEHLDTPAFGGAPLEMMVDDDQQLGWALLPDGKLVSFRLDTGGVLATRDLFPGAKLTALASSGLQSEMAFGFEDGSVRLGRVGFDIAFFKDEASEPPAGRGLSGGTVVEHDGGLLSRLPSGQLRLLKLKLELDEPLALEAKSPIHRIDFSRRPGGAPTFAILAADGTLFTQSVSKRENLLTGEVAQELSGGSVKLPPRDGAGLPEHLLVTGVGDNVYLFWKDGYLARYNLADLEKPRLVQTVDVTEPGVNVTAARFLIGKATLAVGDSTGRVRAWFRVPTDNAPGGDASRLVVAHELPGNGAPVTALAPSARGRMLAVGDASGRVRLAYVTNERLLVQATAGESPVAAVALAPKGNGLLALTGGGLWHARIDSAHPEITMRSLFGAVWYEGYAKPEHVWQSTGGTDDFEPKYGLMPLIYGTLKATFYSMLLGAPLALLAAVYTSEFLHPRAKQVIKPTIELMASLPSVVLGFLAALYFAPLVENWLAAFLSLFLTVPASFLLGAHAWQLLPAKTGRRLARYRFAFICLMLAPGLTASLVVGPVLDQWLFSGDVKGWLSRAHGSAAAGWIILLAPLAALVVCGFLGAVVNPFVRRLTASWNATACALASLAKFLAGVTATVALAYAIGWLLGGLGWDPRGDLPGVGAVVGTYVQRNALVVGFLMGFAIIPIIYTLSEDALSAVPEHLRSASLGCGATPWQTATRIIIPTAMSGLFSALMIGLGRAVGETMIVLMAAGNTPVMEMNIFNGFRTLSANIAVEMPEAVRDGTHYRSLYLAAMVLFAITFVVNTIAEAVRLRFRRRAFQL